jgi:hypothetical protein
MIWLSIWFGSCKDNQSKRGWRVVSSYYKTNNKGESTHFVMEKTVTNDKQLIEGLVLKEMKLDEFYEKMQVPNYSPKE